MQTFVPTNTVPWCAKLLDYRRLGKQRAEARHILRILGVDSSYEITPNTSVWSGRVGEPLGYRNHPAVLMWKGYENALCCYYNAIVEEWIDRGFKNNMPFLKVDRSAGLVQFPPWWGGPIHASHRAALLAKDLDFYSQWGWAEEPKIAYYWPTKEGVC